MIKVKLTKVSENKNNMRTNVVEGEAGDYPKVGERFQMLGPALYEDWGARLVSTSPVVSIEEQRADEIVFKTENSTYKLEIL